MTNQTVIIDVHCHLHAEDFDGDRDQVLGHAHDTGVCALLCMGENAEDNERVLQTTSRSRLYADGEKHPLLVPCLGLHPDSANLAALATVCEQLRSHQQAVAAVGEVGLDYWIAKDDQAKREVQQQVFATLVQLAKELNIPLSVHSRSAGHHAIALLEREAAPRTCLHAFDGAAKHAVRGAELGFFFSVPPSVRRSPQKQKMVRRLPLHNLLLETDSPALAAQPGVRNEPSAILESATAIAEIKSLPLDRVLEQTYANTLRWLGPRSRLLKR